MSCALLDSHLPTHRVVSRFATKENFRKGAIESKLALWKDGRSSGLTLYGAPSPHPPSE